MVMGLASGWLWRRDPGGLDLLLRVDHGLAEAAHAAEHHRRRGGGLSADDRLGGGDGPCHADAGAAVPIIFMWTPPHFWALALFVQTDYAKVGIPMMPVVAGERPRGARCWPMPCSCCRHAGALVDRRHGAVYGLSALVLGLVFLALSVRVGLRTSVPDDRMKPEKRCSPIRSLSLRAVRALVADRWPRCMAGKHEPQ
jgi:hypothetical protein